MAAEIKLFDDLDAVEQDAAGALDRGAQPLIDDRLDWFRLVAQHTPEGKTLVVRARNGVARAWLFLSVRGRTAEALINWCSVRYGPVVDGAEAAGRALDGLVGGLRRAGVTRLYLEPMDDAEPLARALKRRGWAAAVHPLNFAWRINTSGLSFEEYWESRPGELRKGVDRRVRQGKLQCVVYTRFDEQAWQDYEAVYAASWKPEDDSPEFLRGLAEQEGAAGALRLGVAYHDGQAVAAQLWLVENGLATIHKSAYREDARHLAPGNILRRELFRHAIDVDRVATIDFGLGAHPYKAEWMTHRVPRYSLTAYDLLHPLGWAGAARAIGAKLGLLGRARPQSADGKAGSGAD